MDDIVKQALKKWPNVPNCHGWLALDARGDWYMRDERVQQAGPFPQVKGSRVEHEKLREFIGRNYAADDAGDWFFQNGPQRVYVALEAAPWVWRLAAAASLNGAPTASPAVPATASKARPTITSHTGAAAQFQTAWLDEHGRLFLATDVGFGVVHTLDMECAADAVEAGTWVPQTVHFDTLPERFGYRLAPAPSASIKPGA